MISASLTSHPLPAFDGYAVTDLLFDAGAARVYRARRVSDEEPVILKTVGADESRDRSRSKLQHEFAMTRRVRSPQVIEAYGLERAGPGSVLVLEDFGGESLETFRRRRRMEVAEILRIGIQVADGLVAVHQAGIIHKDINPANIVYNPATGVAKIIDFGIATDLAVEQPGSSGPRAIEGSLPYLSPEQTGRMHRSIDYRTDFYSLGVTLYELLTGRPLFTVSEPLEWLHCHIALRPRAASAVDASVPEALSDIVSKLLEKTADARYQSATAVATDLRRCLEIWEETGRVDPFTLGEDDFAEHFQLPSRLYGREGELAEVLQSFDRVAAGATETILIAGPAGIGKSRLVQEVAQSVSQRGGQFVVATVHPSNQDLPYGALAAILRDLVRQLLTTSESALAEWRERIQDAVGSNGALLLALVPELEMVIGRQPPVPALAPREAEQRFHRTWQNFITVFCTPEKPLVVYLDDLRTIDLGTLRLAGYMLADSRFLHMQVIASVRPNEFEPGDPVLEVISNLRGLGVAIREITLEPLGRDALEQLLADALLTSRDEVRDLAELVDAKTGSSPFFIEEFLDQARLEHLITWDAAHRRWTWDPDGIRRHPMTENLVEVMTAKLKRLDPETCEILEIASCIGTRFQPSVLVEVAQAPQNIVVRALREGYGEGLLTSGSETYRALALGDPPDLYSLQDEIAFGHDRIQRAAYSLLDDQSRKELHLRIGRTLRSRYGPDGTEAELFDLLRHLETAVDLVTDPAERLDLCRLHRAAAGHAKSATAFPTGLGHATAAIRLLEADAWQTRYSLWLDLHLLAAELAYLSGEFDASEALVAAAEPHVADLLDEARLEQMRIGSRLAQGEPMQAVRIAKPLLRRLGHPYPERPNRLHVVAKLVEVNWLLRGVSTRELRDLPPMTDPHHLMAMSVGDQIGGAALFAEPILLPLMVLHAVKISIQHGFCATTCASFGTFAAIVAGGLGDTEKAKQFTALALEMTERPDARPRIARTQHVCHGFARFWYEPGAAILDGLREAHRMALETGDFEYGSHTASVHAMTSFSAGVPLDQLDRELEEWIAAVEPLRQGAQVNHMAALRQFVHNAMGESSNPHLLVGPFYDINVALPKDEKTGDRALAFTARMSQLALCYHFDDHANGLVQADKLRELYGETLGNFGSFRHPLLDALTRLKLAREESGRRRRRLVRQARQAERQLEKFARTSPMNVLNKYRLVQAERARSAGRDLEAHNLYEESAELAREQGFTHEEALAYELCGRMHMEAGRPTVGEPYLARAVETYRRWGAVGIARRLEGDFPQVRETAPSRAARGGTTTSSLTTGDLVNVNIGSLMKALRSIADERAHSRMVAAIIETSIEFAGAEKGILALRDSKSRLCVEAEGAIGKGAPRVLQSQPLTESSVVSQAVVNYVARTGTSVVIHDAQQPTDVIPGLHQDPYIREHGIRSLLCMPIKGGAAENGELIGVIYLENNLASHCFTAERFGTLEIIGLAAAGRLELSRKAAVDGLTELYNHEYFQTMLNQEFAVARGRKRELALVMADIDNFKVFNDTWGHQAGDIVLREVARILRESCRATDIAARYGGEELAMIMLETDREGATKLAERLRARVEAAVVMHEGQELRVTLSVGVAALNEADAEKESLIRRADAALYRAKRQGRNRVEAA